MPDTATLADLGAAIDLEIRANGPMSVATYMARCLSHPRRGYYAAGDPLGANGDFVTAPEISQMFGELIGFFCVNLWQQMGEPKSFTLLELGPGRGTLMQDALRAAARAPGFLDALHLQLFEQNHDLRTQQRARLGQFHPYWADEIDAVGDGPLLVVANEFFDALPIRQFVKADDSWHERLVGLRDGKRVFGLDPTPIPDPSVPVYADVGEVYEAGLDAADAVHRLAAVVARQGGAILAIDYGYDKTRTGETLQAVRDHKFADPLDAPGETDLSAHVNFSVLSEAARNARLRVAPLATQGEFLHRLGINERAATLFRGNPDQAATIAAALERLVSPQKMGTLFKAFCAHSPGLKPEGFA